MIEIASFRPRPEKIMENYSGRQSGGRARRGGGWREKFVERTYLPG